MAFAESASIEFGLGGRLLVRSSAGSDDVDEGDSYFVLCHAYQWKILLELLVELTYL